MDTWWRFGRLGGQIPAGWRLWCQSLRQDGPELCAELAPGQSVADLLGYRSRPWQPDPWLRLRTWWERVFGD